MRLLIVSMSFPLPLKAGGRIRVFHLIKRLAARHQITLLCLADSPAEVTRHLPELHAYCERIETVPWRPGLLGLLGRLLLGGWRRLDLPLVVLNKRSPELARRLRALLREGRYDLVQIEWAQMAQHVDEADRSFLQRAGVLIEHDVAWVPLAQRAALAAFPARWFWRREARLMRTYEEATWGRFARVVAVSDVDARRIRPADRVAVVPNGVEAAFYAEPPTPPKAPHTLIFIGWLRHGPNVDAIRFFLEAVYPTIVRGIPGVRLMIVGAPVSRAIARLASRASSVELTGYVPDVRPLLRAATASVVPLRIGGGTRLKILESMAAGTAVVSTAIGCEGLGLEPGRHLLVGDGPEAFAREAVRVMTDPALREGLEREALALVRSRYDWSSIAETMDGVYRSMGPR